MLNLIKIRLSETASEISKFLLVYLIYLTTFIIIRFTFLYYFGNWNELTEIFPDIAKAFITGYRYDTVVIFYGLIPLLAWITLIRPFIISQLYIYKTEKWIKKYLVLSFFTFLYLHISDFLFFKFFQSHFNLLVFGLIDDDTIAVLKSIALEHPIIQVFIILSLSTWLFSIIIKNIFNLTFSFKVKSVLGNIVLILISIGFFVLGIRGSVGTFPLEKDDSNISSNQFINTLTINGIFALKDAFSDREKYSITTDTSDTFTKNGFPDFETAVQVYFELPVKPDYSQALKLLIDTTRESKYLDSLKPNVVFIQMESMSNYYLNYHSSTFNLLGELENQLSECYLFRDFTSIRNGTIHSLEGLMVNTPLTPLSQSQYLKTTFSTSVSRPYKEKGYKTRFVTGAKLGWRNLDKFVENQYFESAEGSATLIEKVPGAAVCEWGVFDEFMFERIFQHLDEEKNPQFIFAMSTTNHTPFELPSAYKPYSLNLPEELETNLRCDKTIARKNFTNYQYANNALGKFIKQVRNSRFGNNTIIAASGDHNTLQTFDYPNEQNFQKLSVPMVLYVPERLRPKNHAAKGFGSHKDIFPTLYSLSLSNSPFFVSGINLLDSIDSEENFGFNEFQVAFNKIGMVDLIADDLKYTWKEQYQFNGTKWPENKKQIPLLAPNKSTENKALARLSLKLKAYRSIMKYIIQRECLGKHLFE